MPVVSKDCAVIRKQIIIFLKWCFGDHNHISKLMLPSLALGLALNWHSINVGSGFIVSSAPQNKIPDVLVIKEDFK